MFGNLFVQRWSDEFFIPYKRHRRILTYSNVSIPSRTFSEMIFLIPASFRWFLSHTINYWELSLKCGPIDRHVFNRKVIYKQSWTNFRIITSGIKMNTWTLNGTRPCSTGLRAFARTVINIYQSDTAPNALLYICALFVNCRQDVCTY